MSEQTGTEEKKTPGQTSTGSRLLWMVLALTPLLMPGAAALLAYYPFEGVWIAWAFIFILGALFTVILVIAYPARLLSKQDRTWRLRQTLIFVICLLGVYWVYANASPFGPAREKLFNEWEDRLNAFAASVEKPDPFDEATQIPVTGELAQITSSAWAVPDANGDLNITVIINGSNPLMRWAYIYLPNRTLDVPTEIIEDWPEPRVMSDYWLEASSR
jgi:hypothetical protein